MNPLLFGIALRHLLARKRQTFVSLLGIVLGTAFFLGISAMMQGSEADFIHRLIDNSPHITVEDQFRNPQLQPIVQLYPGAVIQMHRVKPETETRGIRHYEQALDYLQSIPGLTASPMLQGQGLMTFAGKDEALSLNGMVPKDIESVSTIGNYMIDGSVKDLTGNPDGIIIGSELARILSLEKGESITISASTGQVHTFKIVGIFHTGRSAFDQTQVFLALKKVQALLNRPNRANQIVVKLDDPYAARDLSAQIESRLQYKSVSWQEASEDIMSALALRNIIMYSVVGAVLLVAAFGIYNVISTVVMEKQRDIAILKSMGFHARDVQTIFLMEGILLGVLGCAFGLPFGTGIMFGLGQLAFKFPGTTQLTQMPIDWSWQQFAIAGSFALIAAIGAALLPARKAAKVRPVDILRGAGA
ncbi:MAG: ABC transporter permease [Pseudomonadota bacterium]